MMLIVPGRSLALFALLLHIYSIRLKVAVPLAMPI